MEVWSPNRWTAREFLLVISIAVSLYILVLCYQKIHEWFALNFVFPIVLTEWIGLIYIVSGGKKEHEKQRVKQRDDTKCGEL